MDANFVNLSLCVKYGLLQHENNTCQEFDSFAPGIKSNALEINNLFGIGPIDITAKATDDNAESVETTVSGWIIGRFIFVSSI